MKKRENVRTWHFIDRFLDFFSFFFSLCVRVCPARVFVFRWRATPRRRWTPSHRPAATNSRKMSARTRQPQRLQQQQQRRQQQNHRPSNGRRAEME